MDGLRRADNRSHYYKVYLLTKIEMTPIEQKEIRGLTVRHAAVYVFGIISMISTFVWGYSKIINAIERSNESTEIMKLEIQTLKASQNTLDLRLTKLEVEYIDLSKQKQ